jgi:hypothetical protein
MAEEVRPHADFAVLHALSSPLLALHSSTVEKLGDDVFRVRVVVQNTGWMPTHVTERALERKSVRPLLATIALPDGAELVQGKREMELGQLAGWSRARTMLSWEASTDDTADRAQAEWVIRAQPGSTVGIEFRHQRAGVVRVDAELT